MRATAGCVPLAWPRYHSDLLPVILILWCTIADTWPKKQLGAQAAVCACSACTLLLQMLFRSCTCINYPLIAGLAQSTYQDTHIRRAAAASRSARPTGELYCAPCYVCLYTWQLHCPSTDIITIKRQPICSTSAIYDTNALHENECALHCTCRQLASISSYCTLQLRQHTPLLSQDV